MIRLCLKHFRQHDYCDAFKSLQEQTNVSLEDHLITQLHDVLVKQGSYQDAEDFMEKAISGEQGLIYSLNKKNKYLL